MDTRERQEKRRELVASGYAWDMIDNWQEKTTLYWHIDKKSATGEIGFKKGTVIKNVDNLSTLAFDCGMDGIVCSPMEIKKVKKTFGSKLKVVVPGIRNQADNADDQKRTLSAKKAIEFGADIIVVGRPITSADSPGNAAEIFHQSIK